MPLQKAFLVFVMLFASGVLSATNLLQSNTVSVNFQNTLLSDAVWEIRKQTDIRFVYSSNDVENVVINDLKAKGVTVEYVLDSCLNGTPLEYKEVSGVISIKKIGRAHV